jgi:hypothetical protein
MISYPDLTKQDAAVLAVAPNSSRKISALPYGESNPANWFTLRVHTTQLSGYTAQFICSRSFSTQERRYNGFSSYVAGRSRSSLEELAVVSGCGVSALYDSVDHLTGSGDLTGGFLLGLDDRRLNLVIALYFDNHP